MAIESYDPITGQPVIPENSAVRLGADFKGALDFSAKGATRLMGTTEERTAYQYKRDGLEFYDLTQRRAYVYRGTASTGGWEPHNVSQLVLVSGVTQSGPTAGILPFTHNLGATPRGVAGLVMMQSPTEQLSRIADAIVWDLSPTGGRLRIRRSDAPGEWLSGNSVNVHVTLVL